MNSVINPIHDQKIIRLRPEIVFIAVFITIVISLLIPSSSIMLDVAWIFVFLIACSITWICFAVKSSADLTGLASLISFLTLLRLALEVATVSNIIRHRPAGTLLTAVGNTLPNSGTLGILMIFFLLSAMGVIVIFTSCRRITAASNNYLQNILPLKQIGIDTDLKIGTIDEANAKKLRHKIANITHFFTSMSRAGLFMRVEAMIYIFILIVCLIVSITSNSLDVISGESYLDRITPPAISLSIFALIPAVIVAVTSAMLASRYVLTEETKDIEINPATKKFTLIDKDTGLEEEIELLNPECLRRTDIDKRIAEFKPPSNH